jgi:hypothetical protein
MRCRLIKIFFIFLLFASLQYAKAQKSDKHLTESPLVPTEPEVVLSDQSEQSYNVEVYFSNGLRLSGSITLPLESIALPVWDGDANKKITQIKNIASIEFMQWSAKRIKTDSFVFYPVQSKVVLYDGSAIECDKTIPVLHKLSFREKRKRKNISLYTYFYDYWKKKSWVNSKMKDLHYPENNPLPGTVVKIVFNKNNETDFLKRYFLE